MDSIPSISLGNFPWPTLIRFQASGVIAPIINWGEPPPNGYKGTSLSTFGPDGEYSEGCSANVGLNFSVMGIFGFCTYPGYTPDLDVVLSVQGTGAVRWNPGPGDVHLPECGSYTGAPCYIYDGASFSWSVEKIAAQVTFLPDFITILRGQQATFSVSISPTAYDGVPLPLQVASAWDFQPDGGSFHYSLSDCLNQTQTWCTFSTTSSGTVRVSVIAQGDSLRFAGHVDAYACFTGDSLLDDPKIRKMIKMSLDSSDANAAPNLRKERWWGRFQRADGTVLDSLAPITPSTGPCANSPSMLGQPILLLHGHSHPFTPKSNTDTLPRSQSDCPSSGGYVPPLNQPRKLAAGPSANDFTSGAGLPFFLVDKKNVYQIGNYDPLNKNTWKHKTWKRSTCDPLAI